LHLRAFSLSGVNQSTPNGTILKSNTGSQTSPVSKSTTVESGGMAIDFLSIKTTGRTITASGSQTAVGTTLSSGVSTSGASYLADASAMAWTFDGGTQNVNHVVIPVNPAAGGGSSVGARNRKLLLGVG